MLTKGPLCSVIGKNYTKYLIADDYETRNAIAILGVFMESSTTIDCTLSQTLQNYLSH